MHQWKLALIHPCSRERASATLSLSTHGVHVYPCEHPDEITYSKHTIDAIVLYDYELYLKDVVENVGKSGTSIAIFVANEKADPLTIAMSLRMGADLYINWPISHEEILDAFAAVEREFQTIAQFKTRQIYSVDRLSVLTKREKEVLSWISKGYSSKKCAEVLNISIRTVELHRSHILMRLNVQNMIEAVFLAYETGLYKFRPSLEMAI